jgi:hypothetical protein
MGGACSIGIEEKSTESLVMKIPKERGNLDDLDVFRKIILKREGVNY